MDVYVSFFFSLGWKLERENEMNEWAGEEINERRGLEGNVSIEGEEVHRVATTTNGFE